MRCIHVVYREMQTRWGSACRIQFGCKFKPCVVCSWDSAKRERGGARLVGSSLRLCSQQPRGVTVSQRFSRSPRQLCRNSDEIAVHVFVVACEIRSSRARQPPCPNQQSHYLNKSRTISYMIGGTAVNGQGICCFGVLTQS